MDKSRFSRVILVIAAVAGAAVGVGLTFAPAWFHRLSGVTPIDQPSVLSDVRGAGAVILLIAAVAAYAVVTRSAHVVALCLVAVLNFGYVFGRVVSAIADGMPDLSLILVGVFELALGTLAVVALRRRKGSIDVS